MDAFVVQRIAGEDLCIDNVLKDPQDIVVLSDGTLVIADANDGIVVVDNNNVILHQFHDIQSANSCCYNSITNQLAITVALTSNIHQLWTIDTESWEIEMKKFNMPAKPSIAFGYNRWISVDSSGNYIVSYGDNTTAAIVKFDISSRMWKILVETHGCIDHVQVVTSDGYYELIASRWTQDCDWHVMRWKFDCNDQLVDETVLIRVDGMEPWTVTCDSTGTTLFVYDYKSGHIWRYVKSGCEMVRDSLVGQVLAGQCVSLTVHHAYVYATCADEKMVRRFRIDQ